MKNHTYVMALSLEMATGVNANLWIEQSKGNETELIKAMNDQPIAWGYYNYFNNLWK